MRFTPRKGGPSRWMWRAFGSTAPRSATINLLRLSKPLAMSPWPSGPWIRAATQACPRLCCNLARWCSRHLSGPVTPAHPVTGGVLWRAPSGVTQAGLARTSLAKVHFQWWPWHLKMPRPMPNGQAVSCPAKPNGSGRRARPKPQTRLPRWDTMRHATPTPGKGFFRPSILAMTASLVWPRLLAIPPMPWACLTCWAMFGSSPPMPMHPARRMLRYR